MSSISMNNIKQIHARTLRTGENQTKLLQLLLQIPDLSYARSLLLTSPTSLSNALLRAYSLRGPFRRCLSLFSLTPRPDIYSFTFAFSACASSSHPRNGRAVHARFLKSGLVLDTVAATSLLDMYSKCVSLRSARRVFDEMTDRDVAMWNSMLGGYARNGVLLQVRELFEQMPVKNVISWTSLISGYSQNGKYEEAVEVFLRMWEGEMRPNEVTLASVLPACAKLGMLGLGRRIEEYAREKGLIGNKFVANALVEMYGKCGSIERARKVFEEMGRRRDLCSWNSMIMGMAVHGRWREALEFFYDMRARGFTPDDITFVGVLMACTHGGLVDEGLQFLESMEKDFSIVPKLEHYGCIVDLLGRAGLLKEAYHLITIMPMEPDSVIWGALLGGCSFHGEVKLAEIAAGFLFKLEPWNPGNHVILSNIYASSGHWHGVAETWKLMKGKQQRKSAGFSFIELDCGMYKFHVEDKSHPRCAEIYSVLEDIASVMKIQIDSTLSLDLQMSALRREVSGFVRKFSVSGSK